MHGLTSSLQKLVQRNEKSFDEIIENIRQVSASLRRITGKNEENINEIMANLKQFSIELRDISDASSLQNSISNVESITEKINEGDGTLAQLVNESDTIEKINKTLDDIGDLIGGTARWKYDIRFQTQYLPNYNGYNSDFRLAIYTQKDKFYSISLYDSPRGNRVSNITITSSDTERNTIHETKITDDYLIGLQIGKRFYNTQFRIGFFENSFGLGIDQFLGIKDQWQFTSEISDFSRNEGVFFSLDSIYRYKALRLRLGAYDIFNEKPDRKSIGIGFGLEFNEDNLRVLGASTIAGGLGQ